MAIAPHQKQNSKQRQTNFWQIAITFLMVLSLIGCANRSPSVQVLELPDVYTLTEPRQLTSGTNGTLTEVAPPAVLLDLNELIDDKQPQVRITYPKAEQVIDNTTATVKLQLRGLSIYKEEKFGLGPHLQLSLDNQPGQAVYDLDAPIEFTDLAPGTHTLRAIALKPWGESFKNDGAFSETTFHVFAPTQENRPNPKQPELIYNQPQGTYGAEPILLDFYLNNTPLHLLAAEDDTLQDWKIRCDINGQSFTFDQWQPIYLRGFKPGQNWIKLTLVDTEGNPIPNAFNSTVRLLNYDPAQQQPNTLDQLMRGELPLRDVGKIADPTYRPPAVPEPSPKTEPEVIPPAPSEDVIPSEDAITPDATDTHATEAASQQPKPPAEVSGQSASDRQKTSAEVEAAPTDETPAVNEATNALEPNQPETLFPASGAEASNDSDDDSPLSTNVSKDDSSEDAEDGSLSDDLVTDESVDAETNDDAVDDATIEGAAAVPLINSEFNAETPSASASAPAEPSFFNRIRGVFKQTSEPQIDTPETAKSKSVEPSVESSNAPSTQPSRIAPSDDSALDIPIETALEEDAVPESELDKSEPDKSELDKSEPDVSRPGTNSANEKDTDEQNTDKQAINEQETNEQNVD
ncbi:MAG: hypothetical protein AAF703_02175 [Cyanobacteria bacterium P01_D01_bin.105]